MHVSLLLFDDVDLLDAGGPYEVFLTATRLALRDGSEAPFDIDTVTVHGHPITAYGGLGLVPSASAEVLERTDLVIVPGAVDLDGPLSNTDLLAERAGPDGAQRGVRWVDAGSVVTGGALSSGIAMALHLVERFAGRDLAERTARQIDYVWTHTSDVQA